MVIRAAIALCIVLTCSISPARAQSGASGTARAQLATAMQAATLDKNTVLILIRSSLLAVSQANQTGNYTVLRDLGSEQFRQANSAAHLGEIFKQLRDGKLDLLAAVVMEPQLTVMPQADKAGRLHMAGFFPSFPLQVRFDLAFAYQDGRWAIDTVSVSLASSAPDAAVPQSR